MFNSWIYILICLAGPCVKGQEIASKEAYFSQSTCEENARTIARNLYYPDKKEWGYKCIMLNYEPKKVD